MQDDGWRAVEDLRSEGKLPKISKRRLVVSWFALASFCSNIIMSSLSSLHNQSANALIIDYLTVKIVQEAGETLPFSLHQVPDIQVGILVHFFKDVNSNGIADMADYGVQSLAEHLQELLCKSI